MKAQRRRAQQGGVLSGVLIITAFLSIIAGAVMTEVTTHFLISRSLVNKVATEATTASAVEAAFNFLHSAPKPLETSCSTLSPRVVTLNGQTAAATYLNCAAVISGSPPPGLTRLPSNENSFDVDGSHVVLPAFSRDEYLIGDSSGDLYDYRFVQATLRWSFSLGGSVSGPPRAMPDGSRISYLVPVSDPNQQGNGNGNRENNDTSQCNNDCVALLSEIPGTTPAFECFMDASGTVTAAPAAGQRLSSLAFFGDDNGSLFAYLATHGGNCAPKGTVSIPGSNATVVAGPIVFPGPTSLTDEIYALVSTRSSSKLVHYRYSQGSPLGTFAAVGSLTLPTSDAKGLALEKGSLPAKVAITFGGGGVTLVQIGADFSLSLLANGGVGTSINDAPYWCHCPGGSDLIGVVGDGNDTLYVLDASLNTSASYAVGNGISHATAADSAGDWFVGANDGNLYEVVPSPGQSSLVLGATFGQAGRRFGTSTLVGDCGSNICVYGASRDGHPYLARLDARKAEVVACITSSAPACDPGVNPRLWARVEVGGTDPQAVHVRGWSYYSP